MAVRVAIIGSGPRGLSVLERLAVLSRSVRKNIDVYLIDKVQIGCGKIWKTNQSDSYIMNTPASEISAFSGLYKEGKVRPGHGPSFAEWMKVNDIYHKYGEYAPRCVYGSYLNFVLNTIENNLDSHVRLVKIKDFVSDITIHNSNYYIQLSKQSIVVDKVVICSGHSESMPDGIFRKIQQHAEENSLNYYSGGSVLDIPLNKIRSNQTIGVIGLGLSFYDIVTELTKGRNGHYTKNKEGDLEYIKSGEEPIIYAFSRSGLPSPARGLNQKTYSYHYDPVIFNNKLIEELQESGDLTFDRDILPYIEAEMLLIYIEKSIILEYGNEEAFKFVNDCIKNNIRTSSQLIDKGKKWLKNIEPIKLYDLAKPFKDIKFQSYPDFENQLLDFLKNDLIEARKGNNTSPIKSALDFLRISRHLIRELVNHGRLDAKSHEEEFIGRFSPASSLLAAGPPLFRIEQLIALIKADVVKVLPPDTTIECINNGYKLTTNTRKKFTLELNTLVNAIVFPPNVERDRSPFIQNLMSKGIITNFINKSQNHIFKTGGINVDKITLNAIKSDNQAEYNIFVVGIPSEHTRWFMQSGSTRPHIWNDFMVDANNIARLVLKTKGNTVI